MPSAYIKSTGMYVPEKVISNEYLSTLMDTSDEWIIQRSGISERRYADVGVSTSDMAVEATRNMLAKEEIGEEEIDCIIFATISPEIMFPGVGVFFQQKMGWSKSHIPCYDIRQQCSGYIYALQMANAFIASKHYKNILVICSELQSHSLDLSDRGRAISVLFGDGAAVSLISASKEKKGILHTEVFADGAGALNGIHGKVFDITQKPIVQYNPMNSDENGDLFAAMPAPKNLFANAVRRMCETSLSSVSKTGIKITDIDWVLPHQANMRINEATAKQLGIDKRKVLYNINKYGNTTAASIPLLLAENQDNQVIKRGDLLLMVAFGSGFTWGSVLVEF